MPTSKTKELAKQLGLLGSKRKKDSSKNATKKKRKGQLLSYLMVIDFESTCWESKKGQQEIIEFPAVLLDLSSGEVVDDFQQYVLPMEHPTLSDFCKQLTGITQEQVDNGVPIQTCLYLFKQWVSNMQTRTGLVMMEPAKEYSEELKLCSITTWSDWDLGVCLFYECKRKQIRVPAYFNQWINIRALYKTFYERKPSGLKGSLEDLGLNFVGQEHSGIDDARNTAKLCYRMARDGCKLNITKCISNKASIIKPPVAVDSTRCTANTPDTEASASRPKVDTSTVPSCSRELQTSDSEAVHCEAQTNQTATTQNSLATCTAYRREPDWESFDDELMKDVLEEVDHLVSKDNQHIKQCSTSMNKKQTTFKQPAIQRSTKPSPLHHAATAAENQTPSRLVSHILPVTLLPSIATNQISSKNVATVGGNPHSTTPVNNTSQSPTIAAIEETPPSELRATDTHMPGPSKSVSSFKTPSTSHPLTSSTSHSNITTTPYSTLVVMSGHKVTPPMCDCGRRTKQKLVTKAGPNEGKPFYVCPNSSGSNQGKGCGFFKWEVSQKENLSISQCSGYSV